MAGPIPLHVAPAGMFDLMELTALDAIAALEAGDLHQVHEHLTRIRTAASALRKAAQHTPPLTLTVDGN